ncbi:hypothetical protein FYC77_00900 [Natrialba swarupiae]|uniref:Small CPxCG-related zinc finger protein n=1 Tax=Natrialba swarupiae TaxID=2448032 RepID=A0A5D5AVA3_9EURY|nr:hypothetical protein [Natrialba swarupiae]TYT63812.1 hypothetical protein FYC77_00900 [Natrialba swarupiae]
MASRITIHCDCGTDLRATTTDGPVTCPDCESTFAARIIHLPDDHDASSYFNGTHTCRGP